MKKILFLICTLLAVNAWGQADSLRTISEQIKDERDKQLKELMEKLQKNEAEVSRLTEKLSTIDQRKTNEKIKAMENLQIALDNRIRIIEETPKIRTSLNGQLAFTELLSIQRDIQPAELFLTSSAFFTQLGEVGNLQNYNDFNSWKTEYDKWYEKQSNNDQMIQLVNSSITLISNPINKVPLYGSIVQSVTSGVTFMMTSMGNKEKHLMEKTPSMLRLLNATSQFEYQKSMIDHEWELINKELNLLQVEHRQLLKEQLGYYGLSESECQLQYLGETLDSKRDAYKNNCRLTISDRLNALDVSTKGKWMGQVEIYMYKVQSLRMRFGQLTMRMLSNIQRYEELIAVYSDHTKFPLEFTGKLISLQSSLAAVRNKFYTSFNPAKYIEDSAVMYIER